MHGLLKAIDLNNSLLEKILATLATETTSTVISGVIVFVLCEWAKEVWLMPLQEYKKLKSKTSRLLIMYAQYYGNPLKAELKNPDYNAGSKEIRLLAAELAAFAEIIPPIHIGIPPAKVITKASKNLIGISNSFYYSSDSDNDVAFVLNARKDINRLLKLYDVSD